MDISVRLLDFKVGETTDGHFLIQMFGNLCTGESVSVKISDYCPVFYCKVPNGFGSSQAASFTDYMRDRLDDLADDLVDSGILRRKKLYGFDGQQKHPFMFFKFSGMKAYHRAKNMWFYEIATQEKSRFARKEGTKWVLRPGGFPFGGANLYLYEANIPPILRFFHVQDISPSGWVIIRGAMQIPDMSRETTCAQEFSAVARMVSPLACEDRVPYSIASFDIEANSSHGDFPIAVKTYLRLAQNIVAAHFTEPAADLSGMLSRYVLAAFGFDAVSSIDRVFPKKNVDVETVVFLIDKWLATPLRGVTVQHQAIGSDSEGELDDPTNFEFDNTVTHLLRDPSLTRDAKTALLSASLDAHFPKLEGDNCTFIGTTFVRYGTDKPYLNHIIVLGGCEPVSGAVVECYDTEREVLLAWTRLMQRENPDILIGYNIFGFDEDFLFRRAAELGCVSEFLALTRNRAVLAGSNDGIEQKSVFLASGEYNLNYFNLEGRLQIDLYTLFRRDYNLDSYKLDSVSAYFIGDKVLRVEETEGSRIFSNNLRGLEVGNYIVFEEISHSSDFYKNGQKFRVIAVGPNYFDLACVVAPNTRTKEVRWCLAKDDVDHHDIFRLSKGSDADRAVIAAYCIQDCNLVHHLFQKIDVLTGFIEMASICSVPIEFLVFRGQGIKLTSYISKKCRERGVLMPVLEYKEFDDGYEGAIVLDPKCDIYSDDPVPVGDFSALYPSCMISENLSHDSKVWTEEYDLSGKLKRARDPYQAKYSALPGYEYLTTTFDTFRWVRKTPKAKAEKVKSGTKVCCFAQFPSGKGIMPSVLEELLQARKATRKRMAVEPDEFMKNILDKRQLGYKVTANSLYGQCGARTSTFYEKDVAASCTATGRTLLIYAKTVIEEVYTDRECDTSVGPLTVSAEYVYGDTDSVFFKFDLRKDGMKLSGRDALLPSIELAQEACHLASMFLKPPHYLEYEKTFWPFVLLSKKRYVGMMYETDPTKCKRKSMGIVLKRRDNAPIVKDVYGGVIDILMKERDIIKAVTFVKDTLQRLSAGAFPLEKLIITKALRSGYKNPGQIAHCVLANRIGKRDPGNKPQPGDRIQFVYVQVPKAKGLLQGDKIETPEFIKETSMIPDYGHYITNQIMKPIAQVFELVLEDIKGFDARAFAASLEPFRAKLTAEKFEEKVERLRLKEIERLVFV